MSRRLRASSVAAGAALCLAIGVPVPAPAEAQRAEHRTSADPAAACENPADVLDLRNWYLGLPIGEAESPTNIKQPELARYSNDPWFLPVEECAGVRFRAAVNGVTTSGSEYPRSELREMNGSEKAAWSSTEGTHTMTIREAITALPKDRSNIVAGQIHDAEDDVSVFKLKGTKLFVTNGDESEFKLVDDNYQLGTEFEAKYVVSGGEIKAYYNGELQATIPKEFEGAYFKAGAYTQANCDNSSPCADDNYGEVVIRDVKVTHGGDGGEDGGGDGGSACAAPADNELKDQDMEDDQLPWQRKGQDKVAINFETNDVPAEYVEHMRYGAKQWNRSACLDVRLVETCPPDVNCVTVSLAKGDDSDGNFDAVEKGGYTVGGHVDLYPEPLDELGDGAKKNVTVHEMGHAVGLRHRKTERVLMNGDTYTDVFDADDIDFHNLRVLYGRQS